MDVLQGLGSVSRTSYMSNNKKTFRTFDTFDVCLLPDVFSDKKNGPTFRHEKVVRGIFQHGNPNIEIRMSVSETANVYCQSLLDCSLKENVGIINLGAK